MDLTALPKRLTALRRHRKLSKAALARAAAPELPAAVFARPKSGFYIPVAEWLDETLTERPRHQGDQSRALALRVLRAWGVAL